MAYAQKNDVIRYHGSRILDIVANRDEDAPDDETDEEAQERIDATIDLALDSATSEADSYISNRYKVPIAAPPTVLKQCVVDIAVYRMAYSAAALTEEMRQRFEDAIAWLKLVSKGDAAIEGALPPGGGDDDGAGDVVGGRRAGFFFSVRG